MLVERIKAALTSNQLAVVIGIRGTGKTSAADVLAQEWTAIGVSVVRIDGNAVRHIEDLNFPLAEALGCEATNLRPPQSPDQMPVRIIVDRCDCLFDHPWVDSWQEQWRALLTDSASHGRLAAVLFGRPLFRQIAGGDASPLLNAARIVTVAPLTETELQTAHGVSSGVARGVVRKTGGHPVISDIFIDRLKKNSDDFKQAVREFRKSHHAYLVEAIQDHPVGARAMLADLLQSQSPVHETALVRRHFGDAHADAGAALEDLRACGFVRRDETGDCTIGAELVRSIDGMSDVVSAPEMEVPEYVSGIMDAAWRCLFFSENALRKTVADHLHAINPAWWILDVSPQVRAAAEGRRKGDVKVAAIDEAGVHPIMYLTVGELFEVVFSRWERVFASLFAPLSEDAVRGLALDFEAVRNRLAHSRPVSREQLAAFELLARRLGLVREQVSGT